MAADMFKKYLSENQIEDVKVVETSKKTDTAEAAASAHGVPVSNIVKSLLVTDDMDYYLVLVPGDKKLDLNKLSDEVDGEMRMAIASEVKEVTGYSIGGVPPFGHLKSLKTFITEGFSEDEELVAAAGSGNSVFKVDYDRLVELSNAQQI